MLRKAEGVEKDHKRALDLYMKACDADNAEGCNGVGLVLEDKKSGPVRDVKKGLVFYEKSCDLGYMRACNNLGIVWAGIDGLEADNTKAIAFSQRACDGGLADGCYGVGWHYVNGKGVEKDVDKGLGFYQAACDKGSITTCTELGDAYLNGWWGIEVDYSKSIALHKKACDVGDESGCLQYGWHVFHGHGTDKDEEEALVFYKEKCRPAGHTFCYQHLRFANDAEKPTNTDFTLQTLTDECDRLTPKACNQLGIYHQYVVVDIDKAKAAFRRACDKDNYNACHNLGHSFWEKAPDNERDLELAREVFEKICKNSDVDDAEACTHVKELDAGLLKPADE